MIEALMASLCVISVVAGASWLGGLIVFSPLHERTLLFKIQNRFRIADVLSLAVLLQCAAGSALALTPTEDIAPRAVITTLITLIVLMWWVNGLRMLSRAGVESGMHRAAFLILVLPTGYVSVLLVIGTIVLFPAAMELFSNWSRRAYWEIALGWFLLLLPVAAVLWGIACFRICRRMANRARDDQARRDGIEFDSLTHAERDPNVEKYLLGRQHNNTNRGIWLDEPVVMATSADPPQPVDGVELIEPADDDTDSEPMDESRD